MPAVSIADRVLPVDIAVARHDGKTFGRQRAEMDKWHVYMIADGGGWNSALAKLYKVNSIPHTLLIGRDGMIIAENLRGQELYDAVSNSVSQH